MIDAASHRLALHLQALKLLPGPGGPLRLADRVYLHLTGALFGAEAGDPGAVFAAGAGRALGAAVLGQLTAAEVEAMAPSARRALQEAVGAEISTALGPLPGDQPPPLPVFEDAAPAWARRLTERPRAGFHSPGGVRFAGALPESQAAHAATTALLAFLGGDRGGDAARGGALLALLHNAHLAFLPDVPHPLEERIGSAVLQDWEEGARDLWRREVPEAWWTGAGGAEYRRARGDAEARRALDDADFLDRLSWLHTIRPPWLDALDARGLAALLCNADDRRPRQEELLRRWLDLDRSTEEVHEA